MQTDYPLVRYPLSLSPIHDEVSLLTFLTFSLDILPCPMETAEGKVYSKHHYLPVTLIDTKWLLVTRPFPEKVTKEDRFTIYGRYGDILGSARKSLKLLNEKRKNIVLEATFTEEAGEDSWDSDYVVLVPPINNN